MTTKEKRLAARKKSDPVALFEVCGWKISTDPRQFITKKKIEKTDKTHYYNTFFNLCKGINEELRKDGISKCDSLESAIKAVKAQDERFIKDLTAVLTAYTSLGELEMF